MEYKGKLYGKVGSVYFSMAQTSEDIDQLQSDKDKLTEDFNTITQALNKQENINTEIFDALVDVVTQLSNEHCSEFMDEPLNKAKEVISKSLK